MRWLKLVFRKSRRAVSASRKIRHQSLELEFLHDRIVPAVWSWNGVTKVLTFTAAAGETNCVEIGFDIFGTGTDAADPCTGAYLVIPDEIPSMIVATLDDMDDEFFLQTNFDVATSLDAGKGNDTVRLQRGSDTVYAGAGNDDIVSDSALGNAPDTIYGGDGDDSLSSANGADKIFGENDNDTINSYGGNDTIEGGFGNDGIDAGSNNDDVNGGAG